MNIKLKNTILLLFVIILLNMVSCSPVQVYNDYDHAVDFNKYKSYAWLHRSDSVHNYFYDNEIVERNVKNYVNQEMATRGYALDTKTPDLLMEYHISSKMKTYTVSNPVYNNNMMGYQPAYGMNNGMSGYNTMRPYGYNNTPYYQQQPMYQQQQVTYDEGTLLVDVIDRKANQLIWRGWSVGTLTDEAALESELQGDIRKIFKKYPIAPPKK